MKMRALTTCLIAVILFATTATGQVFHRCVDATGNVTFSDRGCPTTMAPSSVEVRPNVVDSAPLRQSIQRREAEEQRQAALERQRVQEQQRRAFEADQRAVHEASQQDRARSDALLEEARELRRRAGQQSDVRDRAALNRRAQGLEDSAAILRGVAPQRSETTSAPRVNVGQCMGACASEQAICIGQCRGDGHCISNCAAAHGRCMARCN